MPTQWSEAEQVPLGCIAPAGLPEMPSFTARADVGIGPYKMKKETGIRRSLFYFIGQFRKISLAAAS